MLHNIYMRNWQYHHYVSMILINLNFNDTSANGIYLKCMNLHSCSGMSVRQIAKLQLWISLHFGTENGGNVDGKNFNLRLLF